MAFLKFHFLQLLNGGLSCRRFSHFPILLLSPRFHLLPLPLPLLRHSPFPTPPLRPLLGPPLLPLLSPLTLTMSSSSDHPSPTHKTERVVIKGRVQGVFYRDWTVENARELGLKGWVRNRRDGSVEALFSGVAEKVEEMEQRCRRGPPDAMVTALQVFPCSDDPGTSFQRTPTV